MEIAMAANMNRQACRLQGLFEQDPIHFPNFLAGLNFKVELSSQGYSFVIKARLIRWQRGGPHQR